MRSRNQASLVAPIFGTFRVKLQGIRAINVLVMRNSIQKSSPFNEIQYKFDLKGSKIKRRVLPENVNTYGPNSFKKITQQVLKDRDLTYIQDFRQRDIINLSIIDRRRIISTIKDDAMFLKSQGLMDYSLLIAIEKVNKNIGDGCAEQNTRQSSDLEAELIQFTPEEEQIFEMLKKGGGDLDFPKATTGTALATKYGSELLSGNVYSIEEEADEDSIEEQAPNFGQNTFKGGMKSSSEINNDPANSNEAGAERTERAQSANAQTLKSQIIYSQKRTKLLDRYLVNNRDNMNSVKFQL